MVVIPKLLLLSKRFDAVGKMGKTCPRWYLSGRFTGVTKIPQRQAKQDDDANSILIM